MRRLQLTNQERYLLVEAIEMLLLDYEGEHPHNAELVQLHDKINNTIDYAKVK